MKHSTELLKNKTNENIKHLNINSCIFCQSENIEKFAAKMAPFIKDRVGAEDMLFNLVHCKNCGAAFYDYRYSQNEVNKIYTNYRGEEYQKNRQKYESWYSKEINMLIGNDPKQISSRNSNLANILKDNIVNIDKIKTILDFGGDRGQFIPDIFANANKFVYEISGNNTINDVKLLTSIDNCKRNCPEGFDLILCNHVFEHLSKPAEILKIIKDLMNPNGYLYIEVPFDSPFYKNQLENIQYLFNKYFKIKDIIKKYIEMRTTKYSFMHEHINFYTEDAMNYFAKNNCLKPIYIKTRKISSCLGTSKIISCLYTLEGNN